MTIRLFWMDDMLGTSEHDPFASDLIQRPFVFEREEVGYWNQRGSIRGSLPRNLPLSSYPEVKHPQLVHRSDGGIHSHRYRSPV